MAVAQTVDTSAIESVERIRTGDPEDMLGRIKELGKQIRDAWSIARSLRTTAPPHCPPAAKDSLCTIRAVQNNEKAVFKRNVASRRQGHDRMNIDSRQGSHKEV